MSILHEIEPQDTLIVGTVTGQGAQSTGMTRAWRGHETAEPILDYFFKRTGFSPYEDFPESDLKKGELMQPANALSYTLSNLALREAGVKLDITLGHSLGELGAIHAAGWATAETVIDLAAHRGASTTSVAKNVKERFKVSTGMLPMIRVRDSEFTGDLWEHLKLVGHNAALAYQKMMRSQGKEEVVLGIDSKEYNGEHFARPANGNTDDQVIMAGTRPVLEYIKSNMPKGFKPSDFLDIDAAFHSVVMSSGKRLYQPHVENAPIEEPSADRPRLITPTHIAELQTVSAIKTMLVDQLTLPVRYNQTLKELLIGQLACKFDFKQILFVEIGPEPPSAKGRPDKGVLTNLNRQIFGNSTIIPQTGEEIPVKYERVSAPL